jgi:hypothetical protein
MTELDNMSYHELLKTCKELKIFVNKKDKVIDLKNKIQKYNESKPKITIVEIKDDNTEKSLKVQMQSNFISVDEKNDVLSKDELYGIIQNNIENKTSIGRYDINTIYTEYVLFAASNVDNNIDKINLSIKFLIKYFFGI